MLLTHRKLLQSKAIAIGNDLRGILRNFFLKVGVVGTVKFEARIQELVENIPDFAAGGLARQIAGCYRRHHHQQGLWLRHEGDHAGA
jgi:hypothetical protein